MIEFDHVNFAYPGSPGARSTEPPSDVIADLSFRVTAGEFLGVIGPNGAGKSTVMRLLLGLLGPTAGKVLVDGRDVHRTPARELARMMAAVTQEESLEFPFSVEEVVLLGRTAHLGPLGFESAEDVHAAHEAMRETGVFQLAARPFFALSGGERKRVLLARALAQQSRLVVLDEPAAALDIRHQIALFDLLAARNRAGLTVVVVVHDLNLAAAYCRRLLLLRPGASAILGTVEDVLTYRGVREVFGVDVYVGLNELTGDRFLIPMSESRRRP